ncbi:hypothetical protein PR002_g12804 [Phytophthora rubi]|uniref:Uncharacterized protein n=1 Tax=Phytophthora rubi TaxID=129364 RepID=A0A6A3LJB7_9STRA|nr:hypothetical protein PR002_g12804 [Phytophthora rubi]
MVIQGLEPWTAALLALCSTDFDLEPEERTHDLQKWKRVTTAEQCYGALSGGFEEDPAFIP